MLFLAAFLALFYAIGFGLLGYGLWNAMRSAAAAGWPTTRGVVTQLALAERLDSEGGNTYEVQIEYTYTVAGTPYRGSRLAFGYTASVGREAHTEIHDKLRAAKSVDVRYDPAEPSSSVLSFGVHRSIQFLLAFASTWLAFVLGFTLLCWLGSRGDSVLLENLSVH